MQDTFNVKVKFVEIKRMTGGESVALWFIDPEVLKRGDQMGFVTPVVHALTDGYWKVERKKLFWLARGVFSGPLSQLTRKYPTWQVMLQSRKPKELTVNLYSCGSYDLI